MGALIQDFVAGDQWTYGSPPRQARRRSLASQSACPRSLRPPPIPHSLTAASSCPRFTIADTRLGELGDSQLTKLRRRHIGFVFQFFNLLPMLTAEENIAPPARARRHKPERAWIDELLAKVGLADRRKHRPSELSGGQQQRVAIARALVSQAERRLRRRTDREPRLADERRDPRPSP